MDVVTFTMMSFPSLRLPTPKVNGMQPVWSSGVFMHQKEFRILYVFVQLATIGLIFVIFEKRSPLEWDGHEIWQKTGWQPCWSPDLSCSIITMSEVGFGSKLKVLPNLTHQELAKYLSPDVPGILSGLMRKLDVNCISQQKVNTSIYSPNLNSTVVWGPIRS